MSSHNCPKERVEYPFGFRFPEAVQLPASTPCPLHPKFEDHPGHALPPIFWWNESTVRDEYALEARFLSEEKHVTMNPEVIHQLRFFPSIPEVGMECRVSLKPAPPVRIERRVRSSEVGNGRETLRRLSRRLSGSTTSLDDLSSISLLILSVPQHYRIRVKSELKASLQAPSTETGVLHSSPWHTRPGNSAHRPPYSTTLTPWPCVQHFALR